MSGIPLKLDASTNRPRQLIDAQLAWGPTATQPTLDASGLTAPRTFTLPDHGGVVDVLAWPRVNPPLGAAYTPTIADVGKLIWSLPPNAPTSYDINTGMGDCTLRIANAFDSTIPISFNGGVEGLDYIAPFTIATYVISGGFAYPGPGVCSGPFPVTGGYTLDYNCQPAGIITSATSAMTVTIPTGLTYMGTLIPIRQGAAGIVTIAAASGVTLNAPHGVTTNGVGDVRVLEQISASVWNLY